MSFLDAAKPGRKRATPVLGELPVLNKRKKTRSQTVVQWGLGPGGAGRMNPGYRKPSRSPRQRDCFSGTESAGGKGSKKLNRARDDHQLCVKQEAVHSKAGGKRRGGAARHACREPGREASPSHPRSTSGQGQGGHSKAATPRPLTCDRCSKIMG